MRQGWMGPTEHDEQRVVIAWAAASRGRYPELALLFAVPNGARTAFSVAKRLKAEGLQAGVPDLCLPVARKGWHALWIEVKRQKGGRLSEAQRWWHQALMRQGHLVVMAAGAERAIHWLERYLGVGTVPTWGAWEDAEEEGRGAALSAPGAGGAEAARAADDD